MPTIPGDPQVNLGPGMKGETFQKLFGAFSGKSAEEAVDQMKEFMAKDVEELASAEVHARELVKVRGKKLVIPSTGSKRKDAVFIACLYALEDPRIDSILKAINVKGYFEAEDGSTELREFFGHADAKPLEKYEPKKPGRNILLPDVEEKAEEKPGQWAAVLDESGDVKTIGLVWVWHTKGVMPGHGTHHIIRTVDGEEVEVPVERLRYFKGLAQLVDYVQKIDQNHL